MKKDWYIIIIVFYLFSNISFSQSIGKYGEEFNYEKTENYELNKKSLLNNLSSKIKIKGEILSTCPMKGCWMKLSVAQDTMLVRFKDYGFFVPKTGAEGKLAVVNGQIFIDTLSVPQLKHYAEDAGKSKEEISKITNPEITISFLAEGVVITND